MARQILNTGSTANDNTGDTLRTAGTKMNANFQEIVKDKEQLLKVLQSISKDK